MNWYHVWTLKDGSLEVPVRVNPQSEFILNRDYLAAKFERDPPMTPREWAIEELVRNSYRGKKKARA